MAKPQVIVIPCPVQSHINPMLEFSKCLASNENLKVTFITTSKINPPKFLKDCPINLVSISDGSEEIQEPENVESSFKRFEAVVSRNLNNFIDGQKGSIFPARVLVYDSVYPWMLDIAHGHGLLGASFFIYSCSSPAIWYHVREGTLRFPYEGSSEMVSLPALPALGIDDLPLFLDKAVLKLLLYQFANLGKADFALFNTFDKLENEVVDWMSRRWAVKTIGPTTLLHKIYESNSNMKNHMISLFEPNSKGCMEWLDSRETSSVVYVSFGSLISLKQEQMEEIAQGLIISECNFLWVVRDSEEHKLPPNFKSLASEKGIIVNWCSQTEVLAHRALACYVTHCGWNSTAEGLSYGVPLIAMPHWYDQPMNSKFVEDVWGVGVRVKVGENGIFTREEIAKCVKEVTQGDKGKEIKRNVVKWKKLAEEAVDNGGTTANNVQDFVSAILNL